jgi:hypothetical protein
VAELSDEAVKLCLDAMFSISSIKAILSGKAGLMDDVDVLLTYGGIFTNNYTVASALRQGA